MINQWIVASFLLALVQYPQKEVVRLPKLRDELATMVALDQKARFEIIDLQKKQPAEQGKPPSQEFMDALHKVEEIDQKNTARMKEVVDKHGWPGKTLVGRAGAHSAWLLIQHADKEPAFQKKCLKLMEKMPKGEVDLSEIAYLTDRVLTADGKKQRYGTQMEGFGDSIKVKPIEDEKNVDKRRKAMGMPPMSEYMKMVKEMYGSKKP